MSKHKEESKAKPPINHEISLLQAAITQSVLLPKETKVARETLEKSTRNDGEGK